MFLLTGQRGVEVLKEGLVDSLGSLTSPSCAFRKAFGVPVEEGWSSETCLNVSDQLLCPRAHARTPGDNEVVEKERALKKAHLCLAALLSLKQDRLHKQQLRLSLARELHLSPDQVCCRTLISLSAV